MSFLNFVRKSMTEHSKIALANAFPWVYSIYERRFIKHSLGLLKFYNKREDHLNIHGAIFNMKQISSYRLVGVFNSEYADIVQEFAFPETSNDLISYNEGPYEFDQIRLKKGDYVFDCGANLGLFSAIAAAKGCKVFAFEPMPAVLEELKITASNNDGICVYPFALADESKEINIEYSSFTGSTIKEERIERKRNEDFKKITVQCKTIDDFVEEHGIEKVDFIKADIEGAEREMLRGAMKTMKRFAPKLAICTYHLADDKEVLEKIIKEANPEYCVIHKWKKLYAYRQDRG